MTKGMDSRRPKKTCKKLQSKVNRTRSTIYTTVTLKRKHLLKKTSDQCNDQSRSHKTNDERHASHSTLGQGDQL